MVNGWLFNRCAIAQNDVKARIFTGPCRRDTRARRWRRNGAMVVNERCGRRLLLRGLQCGKTAVEIGLEIVDVLKPDMEAQRRAARRPFGRGAIAVAIEGDDQAFK